MARGNKQVDGQLSFDFCTDPRNYVVQANALISGKQALKINSAKLIRAAIMQCVYDDEELKPYIIKIKDLAELLEISSGNIYRDIGEITDDIIQNPVFVKEEVGKKIRWLKIPWVQRCEYNSDVGIALKLNDELKPFLVKLKEHYTQYTLDNILAMKSVYAIRIFELLQEKMVSKTLSKNGIDIELSIENIKECCGIDDVKSYQTFSNLKAKVIDVAVKEINRVTMYKVSYSYIKNGKSVVAIKFHINMSYH